MNLTFKIILDTRKPGADKTFPVKIRVYNQTIYRDLFLKIKITPEYWDETKRIILDTHPFHEEFNAKILSTVSKAQKLLLLHELNEDQHVHPEEIIAAIQNKTPVSKEASTHSIIQYGREQALKLGKIGRAGNSIVYTTAINKLLSFVKKEDFTFEALTYTVLDNWNAAMLSEGLKINAISNYMRTTRAIYNKAIREKLVKPEHYPFDSFKIKTEKTRSRNLPLDEIQRLLAVPLEPDTSLWHYRNVFMLSFCLIGINFADLVTLKRENIRNDRIVFSRKKTGRIYSIKLHRRSWQYLHYYMQQQADRSGFIFPFVPSSDDPLVLKKAITQALRNTNENLKRIARAAGVNTSITTYYARYSWANIARSLGYSKDQIAEALGHEYGNRVTGIYLDDYDLSIIDEMNSRVIEAVYEKEKAGSV